MTPDLSRRAFVQTSSLAAVGWLSGGARLAAALMAPLKKQFSRFGACVSPLLLVCALPVAAADWPAWRGPHGTGVCLETNLPVHWSATNNIRWRTPLPERGNSTPIVWKDRIFLTQAVGDRRTVHCFDRRTGKPLWQSGIVYTAKELTHETNPYCSASPVTDGDRVIASYGSAGLFCYDLDGKEIWRRDLGKQEHIWGNGAAPIIERDLCILNFGPGERTFLVAFDKQTGRTVWQVGEPGGHSGQTKPGENTSATWIGSWTTPVVADVGRHRELIMTWPKRVAAYDPATGRELWTCRGLNPLVYTSPLISEEVVVAMGGFNGDMLAVKPGGAGDVTDSHQLWLKRKTRQRIGSGVIAGEHIYILNEPGVAECIELKTGQTVWEERLAGPGPDNTSWSSMILAGSRLYVVNHSATTFVLEASPKFKLIAANHLPVERTEASIVPCSGDLLIRTHLALWCVGSDEAPSNDSPRGIRLSERPGRISGI